MKSVVHIVVFTLIALVPAIGLGAVVNYLDVPAIPGAGAPQKYPTSMLLQSFSWAPQTNNFSVTMPVDSNSATFQAYALNGHTLSNVSSLFYKATNETHDPYVTFTFASSIVSGVTFPSGGQVPRESIQFQYEGSKVIYLKIPGQPGVSSAPGNTGLQNLNSFTFDSNGFTITKNVDAASPALAAAVNGGGDLGNATLLFYDIPVGSNAPVNPPTDAISLSDLTGLSYQTTAGAVPNSEQITFSYSDFNEVPEPGTFTLLAAGIVAALWRRPSNTSNGHS